MHILHVIGLSTIDKILQPWQSVSFVYGFKNFKKKYSSKKAIFLKYKPGSIFIIITGFISQLRFDCGNFDLYQTKKATLITKFHQSSSAALTG